MLVPTGKKPISKDDMDQLRRHKQREMEIAAIAAGGLKPKPVVTDDLWTLPISRVLSYAVNSHTFNSIPLQERFDMVREMDKAKTLSELDEHIKYIVYKSLLESFPDLDISILDDR